MLATILFAAGIGIILGSNCKVFVLGPAILFASGATLAAGLASNVGFVSIASVIVAILVTLQIGYVIGGVAAAYLSMQSKLLRSSTRPSRYY